MAFYSLRWPSQPSVAFYSVRWPSQPSVACYSLPRPARAALASRRGHTGSGSCGPHTWLIGRERRGGRGMSGERWGGSAYEVTRGERRGAMRARADAMLAWSLWTFWPR